MLKICEQKGVGDQFTADQFYSLSLLMAVSSQYITPIYTHKLLAQIEILSYFPYTEAVFVLLP